MSRTGVFDDVGQHGVIALVTRGVWSRFDQTLTCRPVRLVVELKNPSNGAKRRTGVVLRQTVADLGRNVLNIGSLAQRSPTVRRVHDTTAEEAKFADPIERIIVKVE